MDRDARVNYKRPRCRSERGHSRPGTASSRRGLREAPSSGVADTVGQVDTARARHGLTRREYLDVSISRRRRRRYEIRSARRTTRLEALNIRA